MQNLFLQCFKTYSLHEDVKRAIKKIKNVLFFLESLKLKNKVYNANLSLQGCWVFGRSHDNCASCCCAHVLQFVWVQSWYIKVYGEVIREAGTGYGNLEINCRTEKSALSQSTLLSTDTPHISPKFKNYKIRGG